MNNLFLKAHFDTTNGSKNVILRATRLLTQREILSYVQWLDLRTVFTQLCIRYNVPIMHTTIGEAAESPGEESFRVRPFSSVS